MYAAAISDRTMSGVAFEGGPESADPRANYPYCEFSRVPFLGSRI